MAKRRSLNNKHNTNNKRNKSNTSIPRTARTPELKAQNDAQRELIRSIRGCDVTIGIGPAGTGKAQPLSSLILTPSGYVPMREITTNDVVVVPRDGSTAQVVGIYPQGKKKVIMVVTEEGRIARCSGDHLWLIRKSYGEKPVVRTTLEMIDLMNMGNPVMIPLFDHRTNGMVWEFVLSAEYDGEEECQCIMVDDPDHLYITDDYIVTHNTHVATITGLKMFLNKEVDKIIILRPYVHGGGERLGHLPGDINEKMGPMVRPVFDALEEFWDQRTIMDRIENGKIELVPLSFIRGRTFKRSIIILDEAQNCDMENLKMVLTRLGEGSTMVILGDPNQNDLPKGKSGLVEISKRIKNVNGVGIVNFSNGDIVRHEVVKDILDILE